ncbi:hypothetical protein BJV82DRAFT_614055 [Fennellomyces sp. T-0311]|nr:hypothetical protein BJV82DRAFT_614055 [Fennellomyces sp. T-0311]
MISIFAIIVTIVLVLIPATPLFIYVLGCLLPKEHTVSRTRSYPDTTAEEIWQILTNVEQYSAWQPTLERIDVQCQEQDDGQQVYTEYTARNKRITTVIAHNKIVKRITEEDSATQKKKKPTFVGTWTFEISTTTTGAIVQITEEGSISRPMVRLLHLVLLGFHRRLDRFLKDLGRRIAEQRKHRQKPEEELTPVVVKEVSHEADKTATGATMDVVPEDWDLMSEIYEKPAASAPA